MKIHVPFTMYHVPCTILVIGILGLSLSAKAATYYASPAGGGDGSSYETPASFAAGVALLKNPGDTLYLKGGTYEFKDKFSINKKGSSSKYIVISGYPGEKAVLDFHQVAYGVRGLTVHADALYVHIKDLAIAYSGKNNLYCEGSYCLFERLDIYGSADTGCQMKKGGNNIIRYVDSHDNFDYQTMSGTTANFGGNADGFADKQFSGAGNHYIGCRAWNNSDDGWDFFQRVSSSKTIIENCVCYGNGAPTYNMKDHPRYETDKAWFDSKVGTTMKDRYGQTITVTLEAYPNQGNGNGFKLGGSYTNHKVLVHHCLAVGNYARGFDQNNNDGAMELYNNSSYDNTNNYGFTTKYGTLTIRNCVNLEPKSGDSYKAKNVVTDDHNTWSDGFSCSAADFQSTDKTLILAPRQADSSLPDNAFLRLKEGSALIDAGVDVKLWYNGSAPDLGCYEAPGERHEPEPEPEPVPVPQPEGTHAVAFVTIPQSPEDQPLLDYLKTNDSLWVVETEVNDPEVDYSPYEVIVLSSKPSSSSTGFAALKGYDRPIVLLKPWLLKAGVWDWGTAINTQDLSVSVSNPGHPLFKGLSLTDGILDLFSQCSTNAVTAVSEWNNTTGVEQLASPVSQPEAASVAILPAGTNCNGTVLKQQLVMIGVSEYSTLYLSPNGKKLIENAILLQLSIEPTEDLEKHEIQITNYKYIQHGQLFIRIGETVFDTTGRRISM